MRTKVISAMTIMCFVFVASFYSCKEKDTNADFTSTHIKSSTNENVSLVSDKDIAKETKTTKPTLNKLAKKYGIKTKVYTMDEVDRLPLFDAKCLDSKDPKECSSDKLSDYITSHIEYPRKDMSSGNEGYEIVQFVIEKNGRVANTKFVTTKNSECAECKEAVIEIFNTMGNWIPAQKNGVSVATELLVPVRFEIRS